MATGFDQAVAQFIAQCRYVTSIQDLITKWRLELDGVYFLDLYFNPDLNKYSYTLVSQGVRIMGWDNARHHPELANFPHHLHHRNEGVEPSGLSGDPEQDLEQIRHTIEVYLESRM